MFLLGSLSRRCAAAALLPCLAVGGSQDSPPEPWAARLATSRTVVDRVVIAFDEIGFLEEIGRWDAERYWPVLLWDSALSPVFLRAFRPEQVLFARYGSGAAPDFERGLQAVVEGWGIELEERSPSDLADALRGAGRPPQGAVLLSSTSPEFLGGLALAAGRFHLPLELPASETHTQRVPYERAIELRDTLREQLDLAEVGYSERFDELDFITVANDWPFAYGAPGDDAHPGAYTLDDLLARRDDQRRWGWVGRFMGGSTHSVYMAMGALFLQPESGRFWSRYDPGNKVFGAFDPAAALAEFEQRFPVEVIRHPDATLERWRAETWPAGNRFGFLYVNSSGGARSWSMSGAGATHLDVPGVFAGNVASVVHYTHSGSAGRPWDVDSIAGRWMAGGSYIYFGSHAEPYLQSFVSPKQLAQRLAQGLPLGAAMRVDYDPAARGAREMKVDGENRRVGFNMSGPWKLAYFGDPSYRLTGVRTVRMAAGDAGVLSGKHFKRAADFSKQRPRPASLALAHRAARVAISLLAAEPKAADRSWKKDLAGLTDAGDRAIFAREAMRVWLGERGAASERERGKPKKWLELPNSLEALLAEGPLAPSIGLATTDFVRAELARLEGSSEAGMVSKKEREAAGFLLRLLALVPHSKVSTAAISTWIAGRAERWEITTEELGGGKLP